MNIKTINKESFLVWSFVFAALVSMLAKFSVYKFSGLGLVCIIVVLLISIVNKGNSIIWKKNKKEAMVFAIGWCIVYGISIIVNICVPQLGLFEALGFGILFLMLRNSCQKVIINRFIWVLAILLLLASFEYIIYQTTNKGIILGYSVRSTTLRDTYFVNLLLNLVRTDKLIPRFQFLSDEPGLVGTLCGIMLFYTSKVKDLKIPTYIFLLSGIISFSLAFYVILLVYLFASTQDNIKRFLAVIIASIMLLMLYKNHFGTLIVSRVIETEDIDNRTSETFDRYLVKAFEKGELWLGRGAKNIPKEIVLLQGLAGEGGNSGMKRWLLQYGIICLVIIFCVYNFIYLHRVRYKMGLYDWFFLFIFWLSFYQRETIYTPYSLLPFFAMSFINEQKILK